jgi:hypothetical protein
MPKCFYGVKTSAVEVTANLNEKKSRNNKIVSRFARARERESAESSQRASTAFSSQELPTSKQHTRKLVGVGGRIIGPP